jgi:hypothetical protein
VVVPGSVPKSCIPPASVQRKAWRVNEGGKKLLHEVVFNHPTAWPKSLMSARLHRIPESR